MRLSSPKVVGPFKEPILMVVVSTTEEDDSSELDGESEEETGSDSDGVEELEPPVWLQAKRSPEVANRDTVKSLVFFIFVILLSFPYWAAHQETGKF